MSKIGALRIRPPVVVVLLIGLTLSSCGGSDPAGDANAEGGAPYYEGKTITLVVPFGPGGGTDTRARLVASQLGNYIPGNPEIKVENVAGGNGAVGMNRVAGGGQEGENLAISSPGIPQEWLAGAPGHDYDLAKMTTIGAFSSTCVYFLDSESAEKFEVDSIGELAQSDTPIKMGHLTASGILTILQNLLAEGTGLPFEAVTGYGGYGEALLSVAGGEIDGSAIELSGYLQQVLPYVEQGDMQPLFQCGTLEQDGTVVPHEQLPDVPTLQDIYEAAGAEPEGDVWDAIVGIIEVYTIAQAIWAPEATPEEAVQALEEGFRAMAASDEFQEESLKTLGDESVMLEAEEAARIASDFADTSPAVVEQWQRVGG